MTTPADIVSNLRAQLRAVEPDLDTSVGSVSRKLLDAVSEAIAEFSAESHLVDYGYDISSKFGGDLDDFVEVFGFVRFTERRATGTVTFERNSAAPADINIPVGTQVSTTSAPSYMAATVVPAVLRTGDTSVDVPVRMLSGGSAGNVGPGLLTRMVTPVSGISGVSNVGSLSGGRDAESDEALKDRFRATIFQNLAGTHDMYLATALNDEDVTNANAVGASKRYREQVEVVAGTATSTIADAHYIYPASAVVGPDIDSGDILVEGVHFSFDHTVNPPTITSLDGVEMPDGIYDLDFEYEANASRNDVANGITNRVDIYTHGDRIKEATETLVFKTATVFNNTVGHDYLRTNYQREDGTNPVASNYFVRFGFAPVTDPALSDTIVIGGVTYTLDTNAWLVNDVTNEGYGPRSFSGVELMAQANGGPVAPADATVFTAEYAYNEVPRSVTEAVERWRLLTTDVMVHQAKPIWLNLYLAVVLEPGFTSAQVDSDLTETLSTFIERIGFATVLQSSDILAVANRVTGVDAVRFLTSTDDPTNHAIQRVANDRTTVLTTYADGSGRVEDVVSDDDELPALNNVVLDIRGNNTFHVGQ